MESLWERDARLLVSSSLRASPSVGGTLTMVARMQTPNVPTIPKPAEGEQGYTDAGTISGVRTMMKPTSTVELQLEVANRKQPEISRAYMRRT